MEYVRKSLADGHQVFRRSVIEKLIEEIETEFEPLGGKHVEGKDTQGQLERSRKSNRVLTAKLARIKAIIEENKE